MTQPLRKAVCVLLAVWLAVALSGCMTSEDYELQHISETLSVDCPKERLMKKYDSHGGFLGDGTSFFVFSFEDDPQLQTIRDSGKWKPFPVSDNVRDILWSVGNPGDDDYSGPPLITKDGDERSLFSATGTATPSIRMTTRMYSTKAATPLIFPSPFTTRTQTGSIMPNLTHDGTKPGRLTEMASLSGLLVCEGGSYFFSMV